MHKAKVCNDADGYIFVNSSLDGIEDSANLLHLFVQESYSILNKWTRSSMYYQLQSRAEEKLVFIVRVEVFGAAVDICSDSSNTSQWTAINFSVENKENYLLASFFSSYIMLNEMYE